LVFGNEVLARLGTSEQDARTALDAVHHYQFTEQIHFGNGPYRFSCFLSNSEAPLGLRIGLDCRGFRPETIEARQLGKEWVICSESNPNSLGEPLINLHDQGEAAEQLAKCIRQHRFNYLCRIGSDEGLCMTFFVRSR
jgi:hypothetical protein